MARNPKLKIDIDAVDKASKVIEGVADEAEKLDKMSSEVTVEADDKASDELADIRDKLERLDKDEAKILIKAEAKDARADLRALQRQLINLDDDQAEIEVKADIADAKRRIEALQGEARELDGIDPEIAVDVDGGEGLTDMLDAIPGPMGDLVGGFQQLGPGGLVAAAGTAMFALAEQQSNAAIDAQTFADLTGTTVEHASAMLAVFKRADIELGDAADIALQLNGTLRDNPEYARQLGINLNDGLNPAQRLVQVIDLMGTNTLNASDAADLFASAFGEEGVRQAGRLNTVVGNVGQAVEDIPEANVFTDEDVAAAREYESNMNDLKLQISGLAAEAGTVAVPAMQAMVESASELVEMLELAYEASPASMVPGMDSDTAATALLTGGLGALGKIIDTVSGKDLTGSMAADAGKVKDVTDMWGLSSRDTADANDDLADSTDDAAGATDAAADAAEEYVATLEAERDAALEAVDALEDYLDQKRAQADSTWALNDAEVAFTESLQNIKEVVKETPDDWHAVRDAYDSAAESAYDLADAAVESANNAADAALTPAEKIDIWNGSMIDAARAADGPLRSSIVNLIGKYNDIPEEEVTRILADLDEADVGYVNRQLGNASRTRTSAVNAQARTSSAESSLNYAARSRTAHIYTQVHGSAWANYGGGARRARGIPYDPGGPTLVGEEGPEIVDLPMGAAVTDAQASKGRMNRMGNGSGRGGSSGPQVANYITNNFPAGTRPADVRHSAKKYERIQGTL